MVKRYELDGDSVVVVIGSGAGGGTLANELAQRGVDVVCLEAGKRLTLADIVNDPVAMFSKLSWLDQRIGSGDADAQFPTWMCKTVGGTTVHWTATSLRLQNHELCPRTTYGEIPGANLIDWPISPAEISPYYDLAEQKMGVTGTHGLPRLPESNHYKILKAGAKRVGYKHFNTGNLAINSVQRDGRPACQQIGFCMSGCPIGAKWSTLYTEIPKAEATGHFELRTECTVVQLVHNRKGHVTGVIYSDADGTLHEQKARVVCVAGNSIETPRLLLNSESSRYPNGIANGSGQLGRNYMRHAMVGVAGIMPGPVNLYRGTQQAGHVQDEQLHQPDRGFAAGYQIEILPFSPLNFARLMLPGVRGEDLADVMEKYDHFAHFLVQGEDFPMLDNGVHLHPTRKDSAGLPVPVIHYNAHPNSQPMLRHGTKQAKAMFESLDARRLFEIPLDRTATHNLGTARMSRNPRDGVCNGWGQAHDIPNLFISDGSQFSSASSANPTLTIVALAIRQAEYIEKQLTQRDL